jgi:C4-dicarboxylate-specific signal transduction histidine kinase
VQERKDTELQFENARHKYFHNEKMATLGALSAGIIHEVGNPIACISGLLGEVKQLSNNTQVPCEKVNEYLDMLTAEVERLSRITQDVGHFARTSHGQSTLLNLNDLIERTCHLVQHDERTWQLDFKLELDKNLPAVEITGDYFTQILQNILTNAIDACESTDRQGEIQVKSYSQPRQVLIEVCDNGIGMCTEVLKNAQKEFFTTKAQGKGTGLGLSLCQSLVSENNGQLIISSNLNRGTCIKISYPLPEY